MVDSDSQPGLFLHLAGNALEFIFILFAATAWKDPRRYAVLKRTP